MRIAISLSYKKSTLSADVEKNCLLITVFEFHVCSITNKHFNEFGRTLVTFN